MVKMVKKWLKLNPHYLIIPYRLFVIIILSFSRIPGIRPNFPVFRNSGTFVSCVWAMATGIKVSGSSPHVAY